jgi:hypothetical protein
MPLDAELFHWGLLEGESIIARNVCTLIWHSILTVLPSLQVGYSRIFGLLGGRKPREVKLTLLTQTLSWKELWALRNLTELLPQILYIIRLFGRAVLVLPLILNGLVSRR